MNKKARCEEGLCGLCCFYYLKKGYYIGEEEDSGLQSFIQKHKDKIIIRDKRVYTGINERAYIETINDERYYACSFLCINGVMKCEIHEDEMRPEICKNKPVFEDEECCPQENKYKSIHIVE